MKQSQETDTNQNIKTRIAIGYLRVSTDRQRDKGTSFDMQAQSIENYVNKHNTENPDNKFTLVNIINESGSASKVKNSSSKDTSLLTNRPEMQKILQKAYNHEFTDLIIYSRDRFTRNFSEYISLKTLFYQLGITLHFSNSAERISCEDKAMDKFFELMISNMAMLEAKLIGQRVKLGLKTNIINGYYHGGCLPLGYALEKDPLTKKQYHIIKQDSALIVKKIFKLYNLGYSYLAIINELKKEFPGVQPIKFTQSTISQILNNETYTGILVWNRHSNNQLGFEEQIVRAAPKRDIKIVDPDKFQKVQIIKENQNRKNSKKYSTPFLLRDMLFCGRCDKPLKTKNNGKGKTNVYYCKCNAEESKWTLSIPQKLIENLVFSILNTCLKDLKDCKTLDKYYEVYFNTYEEEKNIITQRLALLKNDLDEIEYSIVEAQNVIKEKLNYQLTNKDLYTDSFFDSIQFSLTSLEIKKEMLIKQQDELNKKMEVKKLTLEDFKKCFDNIITDFFNVSNSSSSIDCMAKNRLIRILLEQVLDSVVINHTPYGETLNISLKIPHAPFTCKLPLDETCPIHYIKSI